jgi:hypothetical protein
MFTTKVNVCNRINGEFGREDFGLPTKSPKIRRLRVNDWPPSIHNWRGKHSEPSGHKTFA